MDGIQLEQLLETTCVCRRAVLARPFLWASLLLLGAVSVAGQPIYTSSQILQTSAPQPGQPEDEAQLFGWNLAADASRLLVADRAGFQEYLWDSGTKSWIMGAGLYSQLPYWYPVAAGAGRVAYLAGGGFEVLGPPDVFVSTSSVSSIAMAETTVAVGNVKTGTTQSTVLVFTVDGGGIVSGPQTIGDPSLATPTTPSDYSFGRSLALSDDARFLAVGAPSPQNIGLTGRVYVFERVAGVYQLYHLYEDVEPANDFGQAVALNEDGSLLVVGAPREDPGSVGGSDDRGAVFIYDNFDPTAKYLAVFGGSGPGNILGTSVDVAGRSVVAGEPGWSGTEYFDGRAVVFQEKTPPSWSKVAYLQSGTMSEQLQQIGWRVSMMDEVVVASAPYRAYDATHTDRGAVFSYIVPIIPFFADGFESGDVTSWTSSTP